MSKSLYLHGEVLRRIEDFRHYQGRYPNELRLSGKWLNEFDRLCAENPNRKPDIKGKVKHWWFMGLRVFREHFSNCCDYSKETALIKKRLRRSK